MVCRITIQKVSLPPSLPIPPAAAVAETEGREAHFSSSVVDLEFCRIAALEREGGREAVSMMMRSMMATTTVLVAYYISDEREERGSVEVVFAIARIAAASLAFSCLLLGAPSQRWTCFLPT